MVKHWIATKRVIDMETMETVSCEGYWHDGPIAVRADPATIIALVGLAVSGATSGYQIANQPSAPKPAPTATPAVTALQNTATQNAERAAVSQQLPNVLEQNSGLAGADYDSQIAQLLAGIRGQAGSSGAASNAISQVFGLPSPGATGNFTPAGSGGSGGSVAPGTPINLSDFVSQFMVKG